MARPATAAVRLLTGEREPVRLATTTNIDVDAGGLMTIDGVLTEVGDRVLVKNQTDGSENGIRTASTGQWFRASDSRTARTMQKGTTVHVQEGTANAGKTFVFNTLDPVIGDTAIVISFYISDTAVNDAQAAATAAAGSASAAAGSATSASTSAANAAASATNANNSAAAASGSASAAATSATNAGNSATAATGSASSAATSATNAGNSATAAAGSASSASTSAGILSALVAGFAALWTTVLQTATYAEAWMVLKLNGSLSTRTLIKALVPQVGMSVLLTEANRVGNFIWTLGDFTARIAADPLEGHFLKANGVAASIGAWVRDADIGTLYARRFGMVCDGVAVDGPAIQAAVTLGTLLGSGAVVLPVGDIKTTAAITSLASNLQIYGHGTATRIKPATAGQDVFVFGDGVNRIQHAGIYNLNIVPTALIECGVRAKDYFWFTTSGVKVSGSHNVGIELEKGPHGSYLGFVENCFTDQSTLYGMAVGRLGTGTILGVYLNNAYLNGAAVACLNIESVSGFIWSGGEALGGSRAVRLSPAAAQQVRACTFSNLALDTTTNEIVRIEMISAGRRVSTIKFDSVSFNASLTSAGMIIAGLSTDATLIDQIQINDCEFTINCTHGLYTTYCTDIDITGTQFTSNGQPGVGSGVYLDTGTSNVRITGGSSNGGSGFTSTQLYGVLTAPGVTGVVLDGVNLAGNATGPVSDSGTGTIIRDCTGAKAFNRGQAQLLIATTSVAVTHGLAFTPAVGDITLTNLVDPGVSGVTRLWVSATSATTFTVSTNVAAPSGHFFGWSVGVKGN